jgi:hypothetical protein
MAERIIRNFKFANLGHVSSLAVERDAASCRPEKNQEPSEGSLK